MTAPEDDAHDLASWDDEFERLLDEDPEGIVQPVRQAKPG